MLVSTVLLLVGLALIIKGGDLFVSASVRIAEFFRVPRVIIGSTLVSLATTSPELVVSVMAALAGESGLAIGNAVGSSICNIGLILGLTAALKHVVVHPSALRLALASMCSLGVILFLMTFDLRLTRVEGGILVILGLAYFIYEFNVHRLHPKPREMAEAVAIEKEAIAGHSWLQTIQGTTVQFLLGAATVVLGSRLLVDSVVKLAEALGIPPIVIGFTVVSVGTSLPELVTAVSSSRRNVSDLAVGNVLGANIANLSLIAGTAAAIDELTLDRATHLFNFPATLILMALVWFLVVSRHGITRRAGVGLLALYVLYLAGLLTLTTLAYP